MPAQLTEGWWKTAWPSKTLPKSFNAMKLAIKEAKLRRRGLSVIAYRKALHEALDLIDKLEKEADAQFKTAPVDKKRAKSNLGDFRKLLEKELAGAKMDEKPVTVFKKPFGTHLKTKLAALLGQGYPEVKNLPDMYIELKLMSGFVDELRDQNAEAMLNTQCNKLFDKCVEATAKSVHGLYKSRNYRPSSSDLKSVDKLIEENAEDLSQALTQVPAEVLRKIGLSVKLAREYKIDRAVGVTSGAVGVGLAAGGLALPGTTAFAAVGLIRAALALLDEIVKLTSKVETKMAALDSDLVLLKNAFGVAHGKAGKMSGGDKAAELTFSTINTLIGKDLMVTVKSADAQLKDIEGHVAYLLTQSQKLQKQILKALDKDAELVAKTQKAMGKKRMSLAFHAKKLDNARKSINGLLDKTHDLVKRVNAADDGATNLRRQMKKLKDPGQNLKNLQTAVDVMINVGTAIVGVRDAGWIGKDGRSVLVAAAGVYTEMGTAMKDAS